MNEVKEINEFMEQMGDDIEVIWGVTFDDKLEEKVKVTLLATGSEMSVVPTELREELRKKLERAAETGNIYTEEIDAQVDTETPVAQPRVSWGAKPVDVMDQFKEALYGTPTETKVTISLDQFDDDDEMLRRMEIEPAIERR
jgi:cell division protein FtsZ